MTNLISVQAAPNIPYDRIDEELAVLGARPQIIGISWKHTPIRCRSSCYLRRGKDVRVLARPDLLAAGSGSRNFLMMSVGTR